MCTILFFQAVCNFQDYVVNTSLSSGEGRGEVNLYTCTGSVKFFSIKPLIINKNVYNFIFPGSVKFSV